MATSSSSLPAAPLSSIAEQKEKGTGKIYTKLIHHLVNHEYVDLVKIIGREIAGRGEYTTSPCTRGEVSMGVYKYIKSQDGDYDSFIQRVHNQWGKKLESHMRMFCICLWTNYKSSDVNAQVFANLCFPLEVNSYYFWSALDDEVIPRSIPEEDGKLTTSNGILKQEAQRRALFVGDIIEKTGCTGDALRGMLENSEQVDSSIKEGNVETLTKLVRQKLRLAGLQKASYTNGDEEPQLCFHQSEILTSIFAYFLRDSGTSDGIVSPVTPGMTLFVYYRMILKLQQLFNQDFKTNGDDGMDYEFISTLISVFLGSGESGQLFNMMVYHSFMIMEQAFNVVNDVIIPYGAESVNYYSRTQLPYYVPSTDEFMSFAMNSDCSDYNKKGLHRFGPQWMNRRTELYDPSWFASSLFLLHFFDGFKDWISKGLSTVRQKNEQGQDRREKLMTGINMLESLYKIWLNIPEGEDENGKKEQANEFYHLMQLAKEHIASDMKKDSRGKKPLPEPEMADDEDGHHHHHYPHPVINKFN